ncbi:MAG: cystathionine gamma-synthase [Candidatus Sericytochromatia bacterium]|nr:MAG: cystathionine gamma-synthase [Candidatus Sericytochromatia bacterium]
MEFSTKAIHVGQEADIATGATIVPIYQTSTYTQDGIGKHKGYEYSRTGNPTRTALEKCLASLEEGKYALAFSSGCAATMNVMSLLKSGDHVIASDDLYGGTYRLFQKVLTKFGIKFTFLDMTNTENLLKNILPETKMVWIETPTNPLLKLCDIKAISEICKNKNLILAVDNTFMSPYFQKPLNLGADIVVHSTTKYIGGHSDVVGGAIITSNEDIYKEIKFYQNSIGAVPGPFDCWLTLRGIKTLALRMKEHNKNAMSIAKFLSNHEKILKVNYPGLESHPQHQLAKKQMTGFGGMISFEVKGGIEAGIKVATSTKLFSLAESLGGVESLIGHPATMTHAAIPKEEREKIGLTDGLIRISVGIEDEKDLIEDLSLALDKVNI